MKFKSILQILKNQGLKYVVFRTIYEIKRKIGYLKIAYPSSFAKKEYLSFGDWKSMGVKFVSFSRDKLIVPKTLNEELKSSYDKILGGWTKYFNKEWIQNDNWFYNPSSKYSYTVDQHWSKIEDLSSTTGDIKYVWERSRFTFLYDIVRYDYHYEKDTSEWVVDTIIDWIDKNPPNMGPHYKCSQEISLRCMNWIFALEFYGNTISIDDSKWQKIMHSIDCQVNHVFKNINFSRICVRNNHAITECLFLYMIGTLFPFLDKSKSYKIKGKRWVEKELLYQIYEDGTFLQFSHNYQRVLVQLLSYYLSFSRQNSLEVPSQIKSRINHLLAYMKNICVGINGEVPNYGSNDGALFFKLNNTDYTDFRPQINALSHTLKGNRIYDEPGLVEESLWLERAESIAEVAREELVSEFKEGGIYTLSDAKSYTFFKCTSYKDRPAHADNLHLDIWVNGLNYLRDSGTYTYNTSKELINYFSGTEGHNTVMLDEYNQMVKGSRFIWFDWTAEASCEVRKQDNVEFIGKAKMFPQVGKDIYHIRKVTKIDGAFEWVVEDTILNKPVDVELRQLWHPNPELEGNIDISSFDDEGDLVRNLSDGWWSDHYGIKERVPIWSFRTKSSTITTKIVIRE